MLKNILQQTDCILWAESDTVKIVTRYIVMLWQLMKRRGAVVKVSYCVESLMQHFSTIEYYHLRWVVKMMTLKMICVYASQSRMFK